MFTTRSMKKWYRNSVDVRPFYRAMCIAFLKIPKICCPKGKKIDVFKKTTVWITFIQTLEMHLFETKCLMAVQGHPRSMIIVPIENAYATSYH